MARLVLLRRPRPATWHAFPLLPVPRTTQGVPSPHNPTPAPTGTKELPKRHDKIPTRESPAGGGMRAQDEGDATAQGVPSPRLIHPRPYGYEGASEATSQETYP